MMIVSLVLGTSALLLSLIALGVAIWALVHVLAEKNAKVEFQQIPVMVEAPAAKKSEANDPNAGISALDRAFMKSGLIDESLLDDGIIR